jgi:hypothetical protein
LISRVQQVIDAAYKTNRKIVVTGRSLVNNVEICLATNYLKMPARGMIIKMEQARKLPDNQVVILTTGSQGEEASALARIARSEHKTIEIKKGDTCVVSASPIPGNERCFFYSFQLARLGAKVLYQKILDIHTSGHAYQEDLKLDDFADQTNLTSCLFTANITCCWLTPIWPKQLACRTKISSPSTTANSSNFPKRESESLMPKSQLVTSS